MHILVINGSPKGKNSITLQTCNYLQKLHKDHTFEMLHVGATIKQLEKENEQLRKELAAVQTTPNPS